MSLLHLKSFCTGHLGTWLGSDPTGSPIATLSGPQLLGKSNCRMAKGTGKGGFLNLGTEFSKMGARSRTLRLHLH